VYLPFLIAIPAYLIIGMVCLVIAVGWALAWIIIQCCELAGQAIAQRRALAPARASSSSLGWPVAELPRGVPAPYLRTRLAILSPALYTGTVTSRAMQEATFLILTALAARAQHGYGILSDVQQISRGRVRLRPGTLYTALDRLRADELIEVDHEEVVETRLRRYYRLTPAGSARLAAEAAQLQANADVALARLNPARGAT